MTTIRDLYRVDDRNVAAVVWGANCGPYALAAAIGRPLARVRHYCREFERLGYMNPTHMLAALGRSGVKATRADKGFPPTGRGLVFVQITGPWERPGVPVAAAYRHTHWIATAKSDFNTGADWWVCDVNTEDVVDNCENGGWLIRSQWEREIMPWLVEAHCRATGWRVRTSIQIVLPEGEKP